MFAFLPYVTLIPFWSCKRNSTKSNCQIHLENKFYRSHICILLYLIKYLKLVTYKNAFNIVYIEYCFFFFVFTLRENYGKNSREELKIPRIQDGAVRSSSRDRLCVGVAGRSSGARQRAASGVSEQQAVIASRRVCRRRSVARSLAATRETPFSPLSL